MHKSKIQINISSFHYSFRTKFFRENLLKYIIPVSVLFYTLILTSETYTHTFQDDENVISKCIQAVGLITDKKGNIASGFFINPTIFITNHHVSEDLDLKTSRIEMSDRSKFKIKKILRQYKLNDLAIIEIEDKCDNYLELMQASIRKNEIVYSIGNPTDDKMNIDYFKITKGKINKIELDTWFYKSDGDYMHEALVIQHTAEIKPGNSGGPLVNQEGKVVGVNTFFYGDSLNYAVHVDELIKLLRTDNIAYNPKIEKKHSIKKFSIKEKITDIFEYQYELLYENIFIVGVFLLIYYLLALSGSVLLISVAIISSRKKI